MSIATTSPLARAGSAPGKRMPDIPALDGLRGCAVLLVVALHLQIAIESAGLPGFLGIWHVVVGFGYVGVQLFFILSGFLLFLPYAHALLAGPQDLWPSARRFYVRRARRILPLYYVAVTLLLVAHYQDWQTWPSLLAPLYLIALLAHDMRADATSIMYVIDAPLWSLAAEWQFYLVLPPLALGLKSVVSRVTTSARIWWLAGALILVIAMGLATRYAAGVAHYDWGFTNPQDVRGIIGFAFKFVYGFRGKYIEEFALGMLASILFVFIKDHPRVSLLWRRRVGDISGAAGVIGLGASLVWATVAQRIDIGVFQDWFFPTSQFRLWAVAGEWCVALSFALILLSTVLGPVTGSLLSFQPLRYLGIISFSLYVWHYPILFALTPVVGWLRTSGAADLAEPIYVLVSIVVIGVVGAASYWLIERPFLHRRAW